MGERCKLPRRVRLEGVLAVYSKGVSSNVMG